MPNTKQEFLKEVQTTKNAIFQLLRKYYDSEAGEITNIKFNNSPDGQQELETYTQFMKNIENALGNIRYLKEEPKDTGTLQYDNTTKRYSNNLIEFHAGNSIEVLVPETDYGPEQWLFTNIEYNNSTHSHGWYLIGAPTVALDGLKTRDRF